LHREVSGAEFVLCDTYWTKLLCIKGVGMKNRLLCGNTITEALMPSDSLAPIVADAVYPLDDFKRRTGLESASIRKMRQRGLIVRRIGRRSYVRGSDFLAWYENAPQVSA
jgi:hypothetical protein